MNQLRMQRNKQLGKVRIVAGAALVFVLAGIAWLTAAPAGADTVTISFQKGVNGYEDASDDSQRAGRMKLGDDKKRKIDSWYEKQIQLGRMKRETVLENFSNYRHVLRWDNLDRWVRGENVKVVSAKVEIFYTDEFWSFYDYEVALYRSLDGTKDRTRKEAAAVAHIFGERRGREAATPFRSWITFDLSPEVIQAWVDGPTKNKGLGCPRVRSSFFIFRCPRVRSSFFIFRQGLTDRGCLAPGWSFCGDPAGRPEN